MYVKNIRERAIYFSFKEVKKKKNSFKELEGKQI